MADLNNRQSSRLFPLWNADPMDHAVTARSENVRAENAHRPGKGPKFTRVDITDVQIVDHGVAAVVTCTGTFEGPQGTFTLKFLRVWARKDGKWRIVAGSVSK